MRIKTKTLVISDCEECRLCLIATYASNGRNVRLLCGSIPIPGNRHIRYVNEQAPMIPDWCPLEDWDAPQICSKIS